MLITLAYQQDDVNILVAEVIYTSPTKGHWKFLKGQGVCKAKLSDEKYEAKLKCPNV